ncbi:MAG: precorrin-3B synthase [Pelagimonas sp.]|uniref:precorrin-3B synthase n=1 Tax=Pelagimonas sp. TaxID=2073170 RepID=UPI003D6BB5AD
MSAPIVKGWCPGALRPMMSGDGLVVRIRAPLGRISQDQAKGIALASERFGNGVIDLSARANLQIRGVSTASHPEIVTALGEIGLIDSDPLIEARRNITVSPFWSERDATHKISEHLNLVLCTNNAPQTPGKFGYTVDCGPAPVLSQAAADIRIERAQNGQLMVRADGADFGAPVTEDTAVQTALDLAHWFLDSGGAPSGRGRMAHHLSNGAVLPSGFDVLAKKPEGQSIDLDQHSQFGTLVAFEFGQLTSKTLRHLASLGGLRLTPWRMILVENCTNVPEFPGILTPSDAPLLRVSACTGAPGCPQALSSTRDLARQLSSILGPHQSLHVSGCRKGCAHPGPAEVTVTATAENQFDLINNGRASDQPDITGLSPADLHNHITNRGS